MGDDAWLDFAAGGGRHNFYNASEVDLLGASGKRMDGRGRIAEEAEAGAMIVQTKEELMDLDLSD